jgi:tryptophan synthase alpha chain
MGYLNPFLAASGGSPAAFVAAAAAAGVAGLIVVDLPPDEAPAAAWRAAAAAAGLGLVPLVAPTSSPERLRALSAAVAELAPFVYCVSLAGVTGARRALPPTLPLLLERTRAAFPAHVPLAVGFGLSTREHVEGVGALGADAAVVGSALVGRVLDALGAEAEAAARPGAQREACAAALDALGAAVRAVSGRAA